MTTYKDPFHHHHKHRNIRSMVYLSIGILTALMIGSAASGRGLFGFLSFAQNPSQQQGELREFSNENGYVEIKPTGDKKIFKVGQNETLDVNVTLKDEQVAGYTIPVEFDEQKYSFVGVENADSRFNLYSRNEGNSHLILVAVQQPTNTDRITLYKKTVARLIFKATAAGHAKIDIKEKTPKGYTIKLINEKNDPFVPSYGTLQINSK